MAATIPPGVEVLSRFDPSTYGMAVAQRHIVDRETARRAQLAAGTARLEHARSRAQRAVADEAWAHANPLPSPMAEPQEARPHA